MVPSGTVVELADDVVGVSGEVELDSPDEDEDPVDGLVVAVAFEEAIVGSVTLLSKLAVVEGAALMLASDN